MEIDDDFSRELLSRDIELNNSFFKKINDIPSDYIICMYSITDLLRSYTTSEEIKYYKMLTKLFSKLSKYNRIFKIEINPYNLEILRESNLLNKVPKNVELHIIHDCDEYTFDEFMHQEEKIEKLVAPIRDSNLSSLEKYIAVYNIVTKFRKYKECPLDFDKSMRLKNVLMDDNDCIVCAGFSKLLNELLCRVGIKSISYDVNVDNSINVEKFKTGKDLDSFTDDEINIKLYKHIRNLVRIDDDKYNIHGYFIADATWDNHEFVDLYNYALITPSHTKEMRRLEGITDIDLFFDFYDIDEFKEKISYYFETQFRNLVLMGEKKISEKDIKDIYVNFYRKIIKYLLQLDEDKYYEFSKKYDKFFNNFNSLKEIVKSFSDFCHEYACYIIPLSNKQISMDTIIDASVNADIKLGKSNIRDYDNLKTTVRENNDYYLNNRNLFPYRYDPSNKKEGYIEYIWPGSKKR